MQLPLRRPGVADEYLLGKGYEVFARHRGPEVSQLPARPSAYMPEVHASLTTLRIAQRAGLELGDPG